MGDPSPENPSSAIGVSPSFSVWLNSSTFGSVWLLIVSARPSRELEVVKVSDDLSAIKNMANADRNERPLDLVLPEAQELHQARKIRKSVGILLDELLQQP